MSAKDSGVGMVRPRSPGSPSSPRPAKVQKVSGLRWSDKLPSEDERGPAVPAAPREPVVIREFDASNPQEVAHFTCASGELLWGHLNTAIEGSMSELMDTGGGPHDTSTGGTILQSTFRYRAKARRGAWKVEPAFIGDWHIGYVCYHETVNGLDILRQAAKVGICNSSDHPTRDVVYVNRYDWGHWHSPGLQLVLDTLGLGKSEDDVRNLGPNNPDANYLWHLISTRFLLLDPIGLPVLIQALKDGEKLQRRNYLFSYPPPSAESAALAPNGSVAEVEGEAQPPEADSSAPANALNAGNAEADVSASASETANGSAGEERKGAEAAESTSTDGASRDHFGLNLATKHTEYELGWMIFEKGELVGFVYDGEYSALEIYPEGSEMRLGGKVVPPPDQASDEEEDPPYSPSTASESTDSEASMRYYVGSEDESEAGSQAASGQTGASKENPGDEEEELGDENMSKETAEAPKALETIVEEDPSEPCEQGTNAKGAA
ncbi:hypothetical protein MPTK1_5g22880 [Marchantia polymorpha subsp. ruderalis]|uniref:Uncharacterized protein n=1 Tax=Marchantia polymorpha subsp. ruderalis TaxID=1480154 RepID=A0AAF6BL99_MARPO|nr:hypothetical protein Mp_5g22880 [Marchantia polymorpha subsp. ruderalis]